MQEWQKNITEYNSKHDIFLARPSLLPTAMFVLGGNCYIVSWSVLPV